MKKGKYELKYIIFIILKYKFIKYYFNKQNSQ